MGVYIKGMKMSTNADMAPTVVWVYPNGSAIVFKDNGRMEQYTQAVPVSPHGRCIDADALLSSLAHNLGIRSLEYLTSQERAIVSWIDAAPTIILEDDKDINVPNKEEGE